MDDKIKQVLKKAVLVVEYRGSDIWADDGPEATTSVDAIIELEQALCEAFETESDDAHMLEIAPKINAL